MYPNLFKKPWDYCVNIEDLSLFNISNWPFSFYVSAEEAIWTSLVQDFRSHSLSVVKTACQAASWCCKIVFSSYFIFMYCILYIHKHNCL